MVRGYIVVEGHGEVEAVQNLLCRLWDDLSLPYAYWTAPIRSNCVHRERQLRRTCNIVRGKGDAGMLIILRDADLDDDCPKRRGPEAAEWIRQENLPFPAAVTLLSMEYEALFLAGMPSIAGGDWQDRWGNLRQGFPAGTVFKGNPATKRGAKEWLSKQLPAGRSYKPSLDQLPLTRLLSFPVLRQSALPCFGTLERSLRFLADNLDTPGAVYPLPGTHCSGNQSGRI